MSIFHSETMTIHADFFKIVKEGCRQAFSEDAPVRPDTVFISKKQQLGL